MGDRILEPYEYAGTPEIKANFNDLVKVKITPAGERIWQAFHEEARSIMRRLGKDHTFDLERDEEGFTVLQLWQVAQIFGPHINEYNVDLPFEMDFKFASK